MVSCLEQLLQLRPVDDMPETIRAAIAALREKRAAFEAEAKALRDRLKTAMLYAPIPEVKAAEARVEELERADAQALDIIGGFTTRFYERDREEAEKALVTRRETLQAAEAAFMARFEAAYSGIVAPFVALAAEYGGLTAQHDALALDIERYNATLPQRKSAPAPELPKMVKPLAEVYFARTCLPAAGLTEANRMHTPLAHKGAFWKPEQEEGPPPEFFKKLQSDEEARRRQAALDASRAEAAALASGSPGTFYRTPGTPAPAQAWPSLAPGGSGRS